MAFSISRFAGGLVDFLSARDLGPDQFQRLENMRISRVTRLVKRLGEAARTAESATALQVLPGMGHLQFRTERDENGVQVSSHFRTISLVDVSGTPVVSIRRNNSINDDTGTFTEILGSGTWTVRTVVGSSNISFTASTITKSAGLDVFFPGDVIRIYGSENNDVYVNVISATATTITVAETLTVDSNTSAVLVAFPHVSIYAINGVLRLSDGNFHDTAPSQWYGYIKRDFWGEGITYDSNSGRFDQPPMAEAHTAWYLKAQELVAPTVLAGARVGDKTSAANQIAIHIAGSHPSGWPEKGDGIEWNARDRVTCSFVYDFVQESELGKGTNDEIGIAMGTIISEDDARALMVEIYTGASNASWNRRITAVKLYYKFHDDPDWYEVMNLNVNKGWKESEQIFGDENTGYWIPIMQSITNTGTSDGTGGSGTTFESDGHGLSANDLLYIGSTTVFEPDSMFTIVASQVTNTITLPVKAVNSLGVETTYDAQPWCAGTISTAAVATFYIPFTGEKAFSYNTNTGRAAKLKVPAFRWRAAVTDGNQVLVGNIDTTDENDQTLREASRVIEMPAGMPDTALLTRSKDVGIAEGDEIMALADFGGNWWVLKERNIHVLAKGSLANLGQFKGIGCRWLHSFVTTPWGLCVADEAGIYLLPSGFNEPLTFPIQATYQALTFFNPILTYSHKNHLLQFVPDTSSVTSVMMTYDMVNRGWMKDSFPAKTSLSNFAEGRHYEPEVMFEDGDATLNLVGNSDAWTGATGTTPPDEWTRADGTTVFTIVDLSGVTNFDTTVLQIVPASGNPCTFRAYGVVPDFLADNYFTNNPEKYGKIFRVTFAYRNLQSLDRLNEGNFATNAKWDRTNDWDDTGGKAEWTWSADQTSVLTQTNGNLAQTFEDSTGYRLLYTYNRTTPPDGSIAVTIEGVANSVTLERVSGANVTGFVTVADASSQDFKIQVVVTGGSQGQFDIDDISVEIATKTVVSVGLTDVDLLNTELSGDAVLFSEDMIATEYTSLRTILRFFVAMFCTLQLDDVVVSQLNSYHVLQLNSGTTDETGLIQTQDIVMGNDPVFIRNFFVSYISSSVDVTVKVYLDNNALPSKVETLAASSTLVNKYPILLNISSEVLSLSFESTATDFTIEDMEIPDSEINPTG